MSSTYQYVKAWRARNPEKAREMARAAAKRAYDRDPQKFIDRTKAWQAANPEKTREQNRKACATRFERDREKVYARAAVQRALKRGKLVKSPCVMCGDETVHAHHVHGYDRPNWLKIVWLCPDHHWALHRALKMAV